MNLYVKSPPLNSWIADLGNVVGILMGIRRF